MRRMAILVPCSPCWICQKSKISDGKKKVAAAAMMPTGDIERSGRASKIGAHPLLRALGAKNVEGMKTATQNAEFLRYLEYMKEAGSWDPISNGPVIYFR